jgi:DUF971 family protein
LPIPTELRRDPHARLLHVRWQDGSSSEIDYDTLRGFCPCAACQGHMVSEIRFHPPPRPVTPLGIEPVGRYAVSIRWSDGHSTGIYRFDFLRELADRGRPPEDGPPASG